MRPLVSVIIPVFNEEEDIFKLSVNSIIQQDYKNIEIIIIDDFSDKNYNFLNNLKDNIKLIRNNKNMGIGYCLNKALSVCKGKYIVRHDSDDISLRMRISTQINFLENNPSIDLVGSSVYLIDIYNNLISMRPCGGFHDSLTSSIWSEIRIPHPTWTFRRSIITDNSYEVALRRGQDQFFLIKNFDKFKYYSFTKPLVAYRIKTTSLYKKFLGRFANIYAVYRKRYFLNTVLSFIFHILAFIRDIINSIFKIEKYRSFNKNTVLSSKHEKEFFQNYIKSLK